jgi:UDP-galactopyranose mutase
LRAACFRDVRHDVLYKHVIYSGPIDEYFDFCFGPLPYRSLRFVHETLDIPHFQPVAVVNYPDETVEYTRITEYKHLTGQSALQNQRPSLRLRLPDGDRQAAIGVPRPDKVGYACSGSSMTRRKKPTNLSCA